jgi:hypothetical protein
VRAPAAVGEATAEEIALETDLVRLALRAAEHHPILKAVYAGPQEWLEEAQRDPGHPDKLITAAHDLAERAASAGHEYVSGQAHSVAVQLELKQGRTVPYDAMVAELLGVALEPVDGDEGRRLHDEVVELARGDVGRWEHERLINGEVKWDAAMAAYSAGRKYAFGGSFPIQVDEGLELIRIADELWSVNLSWYPPRRMTFEVNVATPRTPETVWFEVTHNIYPGDYLHLAVLQQHTYWRRGHVAAAIKLKNAPESVVSEGIEETALLRMLGELTPDQRLATSLEWLRRIATFEASLALQLEGRSEDEVLATMTREGFMDGARAAFQLRLIKHPLWGPYQYTYILGRKLVEEADRRAAGRDRAAYLGYLYGGMHTPQTFLRDLDSNAGR